MYSLESHARGYLIFSMFVFGTVGLFVHYIPLPSSIIALSRASLGAAFLFLLVRFRHMPMSKEQIRDNLKLLIISGICIGINWILLFEAFRHTTLAIASICYYMAPVFVILVSPVLLHETLTARKVVCVLLALLGMMFVSGIFENGLSGITDLSGVFFALGAAVFYASVIVCNKKFSPISAYDKTIIQLAAASPAALYAYYGKLVCLVLYAFPVIPASRTESVCHRLCLLLIFWRYGIFKSTDRSHPDLY